jgi:hypothetical protein
MEDTSDAADFDSLRGEPGDAVLGPEGVVCANSRLPFVGRPMAVRVSGLFRFVTTVGLAKAGRTEATQPRPIFGPGL